MRCWVARIESSMVASFLPSGVSSGLSFLPACLAFKYASSLTALVKSGLFLRTSRRSASSFARYPRKFPIGNVWICWIAFFSGSGKSSRSIAMASSMSFSSLVLGFCNSVSRITTVPSGSVSSLGLGLPKSKSGRVSSSSLACIVSRRSASGYAKPCLSVSNNDACSPPYWDWSALTSWASLAKVCRSPVSRALSMAFSLVAIWSLTDLAAGPAATSAYAGALALSSAKVSWMPVSSCVKRAVPSSSFSFCAAFSSAPFSLMLFSTSLICFWIPAGEIWSRIVCTCVARLPISTSLSISVSPWASARRSLSFLL